MVTIQLQLLSGRTAFVEDVSDMAALRKHVGDLEGVPFELLRLKHAGRELHDNAPIPGAGDAPVTVLLRILGGKGGFGAMLRTAGARGVKTTNFDACRDLNGRRLRHVNAAEALREWDARAEERKLKQQQDAARNAKPQTRAMITRFDEEEYSELLEGARERVSEALAAALAPAAATTDAATTATTTSVGGGSSSGSSAAIAGDTTSELTAAEAAGVVLDGKGGSVATGKRKLSEAPTQSSEPKASKLAWDPLTMLEAGGEDSEDDEDD
jgi:hypothetical protein